MDMVSPILDVVSRLWNCTAGHASNITDLGQTVTSLRMKAEDLEAISNDVKSKVELAERKGMRRTDQVQLWLTRVEIIQSQLNEILQRNEQLTINTSTCLTKCHCWSAYKFGKKAAKTLNLVKDLLIDTGKLQEVAIQVEQPLPAPTVETESLCLMPMEDPVGIESALENVWGWLKDANVGIIGLFGMGGVGKTTLLKKLNNELPRNEGDVFDAAFWVVASKQPSVEEIQQNVMEKLKIPYETWRKKSMDEKSAKIYETLREKKYILMLDDVWERLDLLQLGFPKPDNLNKSKIIFTTRSEDICSRMKAHKKIKVTCLPWDKAWTLFEEHVGKDNLHSHPEIMGLAKEVAKECDGLPLALITIGRAMASRTTLFEWSHALQKLKEYPSEFADFGKDVLPVLEFSYDSLADSTIKKCFVYCSLFPEDYIIPNYMLVDLWMAEGYLEECDVKEARNHGYSIIEDLKRACLLESAINTHRMPSVKMHDVIRDMALWISSDHRKQNKKILVLAEDELSRVKHNIRAWNKNVEKMSVWVNKLIGVNSYSRQNTVVEMFKNSITCIFPKLSTLVIDLSRFERSLGSSLFEFVPCLRVLDLSTGDLQASIPFEVKGISKFINLEYLNLSGLPIHRLPEKCKYLSKLKYLLMDRMHELKEFPTEIIFGLTELLVFRMDHSSLPFTEEFLRSLDNLERLQETSIYVNSIDSLKFFLKSENLQNCATFMKLEGVDAYLLKYCIPNMKNLKFLGISDSNFETLECNPTLMVFNNLHNVKIEFCHSLKELDFLAYAPSLEFLSVSWCSSLQRICEGYIPVLSSLKELQLSYLQSLEIISNMPLAFPTLEIIEILGCPKLKQNPFIDMIPSNNNLRKIKGEKEWWDSLTWRDDEDGRIQQNFFSQYI